MKRETLDYLGQKFGGERFTVSDYIGNRVPRPWETKDAADEFEKAVRTGLLELVPGPRGGKGFRLSAHQFMLYQRRAASADRKAEAERLAYEEQRRQRLSADIANAIRLLKTHGYQVLAPGDEPGAHSTQERTST